MLHNEHFMHCKTWVAYINTFTVPYDHFADPNNEQPVSSLKRN